MCVLCVCVHVCVRVCVCVCVFAAQQSTQLLSLGWWSNDGSSHVPWLTLTEQCPLPLRPPVSLLLCSAPPSASPRLLLANSGHLIKGLVGLMVVSVPHMLATTTKPDTWTSGRRQGGVYALIHPHKHSSIRTDSADTLACSHVHTVCCRVHSWCLTLASFSRGAENVRGGVGRVSTGLRSCISLPPDSFSSSSNLPPPLPLLPMPCQIHISYNRAESPCQQDCINPAALSCSCLSPHWDTASCHHYSQKIRYLGCTDAQCILTVAWNGPIFNLVRLDH